MLGITTLMISNEEIDDIIEIVKFLEDSVFLIKSSSENIKKWSKIMEKWIS